MDPHSTPCGRAFSSVGTRDRAGRRTSGSLAGIHPDRLIPRIAPTEKNTLTEVTEPYHGRIRDPACGSGGIEERLKDFKEQLETLNYELESLNADIIQTLTATFEANAQQTETGVEYWLARDLQHLLGYNEWRNFTLVIAKARTACEVSGHRIADHFVDANKMVELGSGSTTNEPWE